VDLQHGDHVAAAAGGAGDPAALSGPRLATPLLLAIAYSASIGGLGTPIGAAEPGLHAGLRQQTGTTPTFSDWMAIRHPTVLLFLPLAAGGWHAAWATRRRPNCPNSAAGAAASARAGVFGLIALAWVTRSEPFGGWSGWLGLPTANDASVALLGVVAMALVPSGEGRRLLHWQDRRAHSLGRADPVRRRHRHRHGVPGLGAVGARRARQGRVRPAAGCCASRDRRGVSLMSEITSNTATAVLMMPILAATGLARWASTRRC
jgi:solute carrier family 13 (sodium-dependent dicarboxylate transporter), member 2/3/5